MGPVCDVVRNAVMAFRQRQQDYASKVVDVDEVDDAAA